MAARDAAAFPCVMALMLVWDNADESIDAPRVTAHRNEPRMSILRRPSASVCHTPTIAVQRETEEATSLESVIYSKICVEYREEGYARHDELLLYAVDSHLDLAFAGRQPAPLDSPCLYNDGSSRSANHHSCSASSQSMFWASVRLTLHVEVLTVRSRSIDQKHPSSDTTPSDTCCLCHVSVHGSPTAQSEAHSVQLE